MSGIIGIPHESVKTLAPCQTALDDMAANAQKPGREQESKADTVVLQRTPQTREQAKEWFRNFLDRLKAVYPELHIITPDRKAGSGHNLLTQALKDMGEGYVLFLSGDFLESLGTEQGAYRLNAQAVLEAVKRMGCYQDGVTVWMGEDAAVFLTRQSDKKPENVGPITDWSQRQEKYLADMLPSPSEQALMKSRALSSAYYQTATAYSRLANAKTKTAVETVVTEVWQSIHALKLTAAYGDDKLRIKAKKAIRALEKLLLRADKKIRRFDEERLTDLRRKRAQENRQKSEALAAELEMKRRKTTRATGDGAILTEGRLNNVSIPGYRNWAEEHRHKKMHHDPSDDWPTYMPLPPATDIITAASELSPGGLTVPEGFQIADVMAF